MTKKKIKKQTHRMHCYLVPSSNLTSHGTLEYSFSDASSYSASSTSSFTATLGRVTKSRSKKVQIEQNKYVNDDIDDAPWYYNCCGGYNISKSPTKKPFDDEETSISTNESRSDPDDDQQQINSMKPIDATESSCQEFEQEQTECKAEAPTILSSPKDNNEEIDHDGGGGCTCCCGHITQHDDTTASPSNASDCRNVDTNETASNGCLVTAHSKQHEQQTITQKEITLQEQVKNESGCCSDIFCCCWHCCYNDNRSKPIKNTDASSKMTNLIDDAAIDTVIEVPSSSLQQQEREVQLTSSPSMKKEKSSLTNAEAESGRCCYDCCCTCCYDDNSLHLPLDDISSSEKECKNDDHQDLKADSTLPVKSSSSQQNRQQKEDFNCENEQQEKREPDENQVESGGSWDKNKEENEDSSVFSLERERKDIRKKYKKMNQQRYRRNFLFHYNEYASPSENDDSCNSSTRNYNENRYPAIEVVNVEREGERKDATIDINALCLEMRQPPEQQEEIVFFLDDDDNSKHQQEKPRRTERQHKQQHEKKKHRSQHDHIELKKQDNKQQQQQLKKTDKSLQETCQCSKTPSILTQENDSVEAYVMENKASLISHCVEGNEQDYCNKKSDGNTNNNTNNDNDKNSLKDGDMKHEDDTSIHDNISDDIHIHDTYCEENEATSKAIVKPTSSHDKNMSRYVPTNSLSILEQPREDHLRCQHHPNHFQKTTLAIAYPTANNMKIEDIDHINHLGTDYNNSNDTDDGSGYYGSNFIINASPSASVPSSACALYNDGATELFLAVEERNWTTVETICRNDPTQASIWVLSSGTVQTTFQWSVWKRLPLHEAVRRNPPVMIVATLIRAYPSACRAVTHFGELPLHLAIECGADMNVIHLLISCHWRGIQQPDQVGRTPADMVLNKDNAEIVLDLQEHDSIRNSIQLSNETYKEIQAENERAISLLHLQHQKGLDAVRQQHDHDLLLEQEQQEKLVRQVEDLQTKLFVQTRVLHEQEQIIQHHLRYRSLLEHENQKLKKDSETLQQLVVDQKQQLSCLQDVVISKENELLILNEQKLDLQAVLQQLTCTIQSSVVEHIHKTNFHFQAAMQEYNCLMHTVYQQEEYLNQVLDGFGIPPPAVSSYSHCHDTTANNDEKNEQRQSNCNDDDIDAHYDDASEFVLTEPGIVDEESVSIAAEAAKQVLSQNRDEEENTGGQTMDANSNTYVDQSIKNECHVDHTLNSDDHNGKNAVADIIAKSNKDNNDKKRLTLLERSRLEHRNCSIPKAKQYKQRKQHQQQDQQERFVNMVIEEQQLHHQIIDNKNDCHYSYHIITDSSTTNSKADE